MRLLSEIKDRLESLLLESPTWRRLLRGLIGKELLSWGATVAYLDDLAYDSLKRDLHPSSASDLGLSLLSGSYGIPFQNFSEGFVLYEYKDPVALKPYALRFESQGRTWLNIDPVAVAVPTFSTNGSETYPLVRLTQGRQVGYVTEGDTYQNVFPSPSEVYEGVQSDIYLDQDSNFFYVRLRGDNIVPSSIRVFVLSLISPFPVPVYSAALMTSEEVSHENYFSVYSLPDGGQAIRLNGSIPDRFQVSYFCADLGIPESLPDGTPVVSLVNPSVLNTDKRKSFMRSMVSDTALSTYTQIEEFCRAVGVRDAVAVRYWSPVTANLFVKVFFLPDVSAESVNQYYERSLGEALSLYGSIGTAFTVSRGTEVSFQVAVGRMFIFDSTEFERKVREFFSVESPPSFSTSLTESLLVYMHNSGFSGASLSYILSLDQNKEFLLSKFGASFFDYNFYKKVGSTLVLDRWSFGSVIYGLASLPFDVSLEDKVFVMTNSVFVQTSFGDESKFYVFDLLTGSGSVLDIKGYDIVTVGDDMLVMVDEEVEGEVFYLRLSPEDQVHAIKNGKIPSFSTEFVSQPFQPYLSSIRVFNDGYFSIGDGNDTQLKRVVGGTPTNYGLVQDLLFVYEGYLYIKTTLSGVLHRKDTPTSLGVTEVVVYCDSAVLTVDELLECKLYFSGNTLSAYSAFLNKTFMFRVAADATSFVLTSLSSDIADGIEDAFYLTRTPAWRDSSGVRRWFNDGVTLPFPTVRTKEEVGSVLSSGLPSFRSAYVYDKLTVRTGSIKPFSNSDEAVYFRLNDTNPVFYEE